MQRRQAKCGPAATSSAAARASVPRSVQMQIVQEKLVIDGFNPLAPRTGRRYPQAPRSTSIVVAGQPHGSAPGRAD